MRKYVIPSIEAEKAYKVAIAISIVKERVTEGSNLKRFKWLN